jgi:hypothetical protein
MSVSVEEETKPDRQLNYIEEILEKLDLLCAPLCKRESGEAPSCTPTSEKGNPEEHSALVIDTNSTEKSVSDGPKSTHSVYSIVTEHASSFDSMACGEDNPCVQMAEQDKLDNAAMMAMKALDKVNSDDEENAKETRDVKSKFGFRLSNVRKENTIKSPLKIFSPKAPTSDNLASARRLSVAKASDMKKVAGVSLRRMTNSKHAVQLKSAEKEDSLIKSNDIPFYMDSQSLNEDQTSSSKSRVDEKIVIVPKKEEANEMPNKEKSSDPAAESLHGVESLLGLSKSVHGAESLLGLSQTASN